MKHFPAISTALIFSLALVGAVRGDGPEVPPAVSGEVVYKAKCASCHGAAGEGTPDQSVPLIGDKSVFELTAVIEKTMPEDAPGTCVGEEAKAVASFIYDGFYSPTAQARIKPARIELSRLTVRQYQNSVTDLLASFRGGATNLNNERGLKAEYYKGRNFRRDNRVLERVDANVDFNFGESSPEPEKIEANEFSIRWEGSLIASETADYEFIVRTEHATRLWLNNNRDPLIDAWVKSGNDTEYRGSIRLQGGRAYPLKLEFSKSKQGVDDSKEKKEKPPIKPASIALLWKLPHRPAEAVPQRALAQQMANELFVVTTPFPPDDRSMGYERGTSISKEWDSATTDAAIETASFVGTKLKELAGVDEKAGDRKDKLREFCHRFAERAFRRPLTEEEKQLYVNRQFDESADLDLAVKRVVLLTLKSPRFLYREFGSAQGDAYDIASRLSFAMWDSLPDQQLLEAAKNNQLTNREQTLKQAERMLVDMRTRAKLHEFFLRWLRIEHIPDLAKDTQRFPEFDEQIAADLRTSVELFVDDIVWSDASDYRQLLLSDSFPLNARLAKFYGAETPGGSNFEKAPLDGSKRAGILTHPYLLSSFAYTGESSPIHRGVFISRSLLGRALRPPPEAVSPLAADVHADLTTRERVALQTQSESCMSCHSMINPLGFTLESFDAVGKFREAEKGKPVDVRGSYLTRTGETHNFNDVRELATFLANTDETHAAFVDQLFHFMVKQPIRAYGEQQSPELRQKFQTSNFNIRKLATEIAASSALPPPKNKP
jgi:hypothetical protein